MKSPESNLSVWVGDAAVWVKVEGRANITSSVDFKNLVAAMRQKGFRGFFLDLSECLLMDSTFLGVLAGLGIRLGSAQAGDQRICITLVNPNERIRDLLENLGVAELFPVRQNEAPGTDRKYEKQDASAPDAEKLAQTSLTAHEDLMTLNPKNVPKFKEVARFLAEDLKRIQDRSLPQTANQ